MTRKHDDMEVFQLWMEYLRRNDDYRKLCEHVEKNHGVLRLAHLPEEFAGRTGLVSNYVIFGDVYNKSDEALWFSRELWKDISNGPYLEFVSMANEIDRSIDDYKLVHGRDPDLAELRSSITDDSYRYIRFDSSYIDSAFLRKTLLSARHEFVNAQEEHPFPEPSTRIRLDELKRYLRVYDLFMQKKKWKEISEVVYSKTDSNYQIYLSRDFKKAQRIIKNVEDCQFPGDYAD